MAAITWRNVNGGPDYRGAAYLMRGAQDAIEQGLSGIDGILQNRLKLQEDNRANTIANNEAQIRRLVTGAGSVDELKQLQEQGRIQQVMQQFGPNGVSKDFDPNALVRDQTRTLRTDTLEGQEYDQAQALQAADPIFQEYLGRLYESPEAANAFLTSDRETALKKAQLYDDAIKARDTRGQELEQRRRGEINFNQQQEEVGQTRAERKSRRELARIQQEEIARGGSDREVSDRIMARIREEGSGVLPEQVPTAATSTRQFLDSQFKPFASEQQQRDAALAEENLVSQQGSEGIQRQIQGIDSELARLSPSITAPEAMTPGKLLEDLQQNFELDDSATWIESDSTSKDITNAIKEAEPLVEEFGLSGLSAAHIVKEAARLSTRGSAKGDEPQTIKLADVKDMLETAAKSLAQQQKEYNRLQGEKTARQDQLYKLQLDTLRRNARIQQGNRGQ